MNKPLPAPTGTLTRTALVVDDISVVRFYHTQILERMGFSCLVATDGQEALQTLRGTPVDLVVLDIVMPNMTGLEFIEQIRANPGLANMPVLLISSEKHGDKVRRPRTSTTGPIGFAQKPLMPSTIVAEVNRLLN